MSDEVDRSHAPAEALSPSPSLSAALDGAVFPLTRRELLLIARESDARPDVLTLLSALPDVAYRSTGELAERLSALRPRDSIESAPE